MKINPRLREFVRIDGNGTVIQGSNVARKAKPKIGRWVEINNSLCCTTTSTSTSTTTTTTTTTTSTTTTTTTTIG